jgi:hypothetical protein
MNFADRDVRRAKGGVGRQVQCGCSEIAPDHSINLKNGAQVTGGLFLHMALRIRQGQAAGDGTHSPSPRPGTMLQREPARITSNGPPLPSALWIKGWIQEAKLRNPFLARTRKRPGPAKGGSKRFQGRPQMISSSPRKMTMTPNHCTLVKASWKM